MTIESMVGRDSIEPQLTCGPDSTAGQSLGPPPNLQKHDKAGAADRYKS